MSARARRRAIVASGCTLLVLVALVVLAIALAVSPSGDSLVDGLPDVVMALAFASVGSLVMLKRPESLVGWALWLAGTGLLAGGALGTYAELALVARPGSGLPAGGAAAAFAEGSWAPLMAGVFLLILVFPSGRVPSRATGRWAVLALAGFALIWVGIATAPGTFSPPLEEFENPLAVTGSELYVLWFVPVIVACLLSAGVAAVMALLRFRRSRGLERQQFKWPAASIGLLFATFPFGAAFNYSNLAGGVITLALISLPVSVGVAVLRYRLYEIDRVISRTLVYGALTVLLGALYIGLVLAGQGLFSSFAGGGDLAIAVSTLVVAALFLPVRSRVQRLVDRRFYRRRYDAQRTLDAFGARLREQVDLDGLRLDLEGAVRETMQPAHVSVWLREARP